MRFWFRLPFRIRLGIIATILLIAATISVVLWTNDPGHYRLSSIIRFAPILFLFWLSWADLKQIPFWGWLVMPPMLILCFLKPALWFIVIPAGLIALFVMPKKKKK
jgi:hypothetical protein